MAGSTTPARAAQLNSTATPEGVDHLLCSAQRLGFPFFLYCVNRLMVAHDGSPGSAPLSVLARGMPQETIRAWQQSQHANDPLRRTFLHTLPMRPSALPLVWENCDGQLSIAQGPLPPAQQAFMRQCYSQGVRTGINIPIHLADQISIVSFFSDAALSRIRRLETKTARLFLLGHHIHSILDAHRIAREREAVHLSPRELECMRWVARGKNATEIAQILGISVLTARDYLKSVSLKLNTVSRAQALAKLLRMGCLEH